MKLEYIPRTIQFDPLPCRFEFTDSGDVCRFLLGNVMVNRLTGNSLDGGAAGIWLRVHETSGIRFAPLFGIQSRCSMERSAHCLRFCGEALGIRYEVTFHAHALGWVWDVRLTGSARRVDVIYGQDVALGCTDAVLDNDLYLCQYLGHTVFEERHGFVICSRQNMPQDGRNPCLQIGTIGMRAAAYSTDSMQFFGLSYKRTDVPQALCGRLPCVNRQFECAYPALQSEEFDLQGTRQFLFYGFLKEDCPRAVSRPVPEEEVLRHLPLFCGERFVPVEPARRRDCFGYPLASEPMPADLLESLYPHRRLEERKDGEILSFFDGEHTHIVTQAKELIVERTHANIVTTFPSMEQVDHELITSTCAMTGLFNGQTVIGNTNKHKLLSASRGLLNRMKHSGMRIWAEVDGTLRLLTLPACFETTLNGCRWRYLLGDERITVETFAAVHSTDIVTRVESTSPRRFIVTCQLVMGTHERLQPILISTDANVLTFRPESGSPIARTYPDLRYELHLPHDADVCDDRIFFEDGETRDATHLTLQLSTRREFSVRIHGTLDDQSAKPCRTQLHYDTERQASLECYAQLLCHLHLEEGGERRFAILNETAFWYAHNALVHFTVPHGLEQPGGAAWGTRDVCQGPFELFLATQHHSLLRDILLHVFRHQHEDSGEWAQWFMFDRYADEMNGCHGDIVFWPLKCVGEYLAATGDYSVLDAHLPYAHGKAPSTLLRHIEKALDAIETRFLPETALLSYAGGDWDDTLQPCSRELQECLVSSWTQALAFQVLSELSRTLPEPCAQRCRSLSRAIRESFERYLVVDGVIAGFVYRLPDGRFAPMLHPQDEDTGIHLRLLPMTRSIIAGLSSRLLADSSLKLIEEKLHCPDGVRLMDHPAQYNGGESRLFWRAEQAANVGREISLQYTHAHIRYIEALCRMGLGEQAWEALFEILPICLRETVPNALPRQSNLYFSSSDGAFPDRWVYDRDCKKLLTGDIPVGGGWRLYSSGPGICLCRLIEEMLGIRVRRGELELDPVLPAHFTPLSFTFAVGGQVLRFVYHFDADVERLTISQNGAELDAYAVSSEYRSGGVRLSAEALDSAYPVDVYIPAQRQEKTGKN